MQIICKDLWPNQSLVPELCMLCSNGSNPLARLLTGWILPMNQQLLQLVKGTIIRGNFEDNFVLQDFILPIKHIKAVVEFNHEVTGMYPLWMVPAALDSEEEDNKLIDLKVYGFSTLHAFAGWDKTLCMLEKFTQDHVGYPALYTETLISYDEFCQIVVGKIRISSYFH